MNPELVSIKLDMVTETSSIVEVVYRGPTELKGIELMGVDAGLSWLKGKSIMLKKSQIKETSVEYKAYIEVVDSCEFRARGFDNEEDHWEAGLANHKITKNPDGTIEFETEIDRDLYYFKGSLPIDFNPTFDVANQRISNLDEVDAPLFQILIDLSIWIDSLLENPLGEEKIYPIPTMIRHLKVKGRDYDSQKLDEVVRPVMFALFRIYKSALDFAEDDLRFLTGEWEMKGYIKLIRQLPDKVKELDTDKNLGVGLDSGQRFRTLLEYAS